MSEASFAALGLAQFGHFDHFRRLVLGDDHLAYPLTRFDGLRLAAQVNQYDLRLISMTPTSPR